MLLFDIMIQQRWCNYYLVSFNLIVLSMTVLSISTNKCHQILSNAIKYNRVIVYYEYFVVVIVVVVVYHLFIGGSFVEKW